MSLRSAVDVSGKWACILYFQYFKKIYNYQLGTSLLLASLFILRNDCTMFASNYRSVSLAIYLVVSVLVSGMILIHTSNPEIIHNKKVNVNC